MTVCARSTPEGMPPLASGAERSIDRSFWWWGSVPTLTGRSESRYRFLTLLRTICATERVRIAR